MQIAFALLLGFIFTCKAFGQGDLFEHFDEGDGLFCSRVYDLIQGDDGNLYFATNKGVFLFNGIGFIPLKSDEPTAAAINFITENVAQPLVLMQDGSFNQIRGDSVLAFESSKEFSNTLSDRIYNSFFITKENKLLAGTIIGSTLHSEDLNNHQYSTETLKMEGSTFLIEVQKNGFVWGSLKQLANNSILDISFHNGVRQKISLSETNDYSKSIFLHLSDGTFLFAINHEVIHFDKNKVLERSFLEHSVEALYEDKQGKIWIGMQSGGVKCYPNANINGDKSHHYLGGQDVLKIIEDNSNYMWFATSSNDVYALSSQPLLGYKAPLIYSNDVKKKVDVNLGITSKYQHKVSKEASYRVITTDSLRYDSVPPTIYISGVQILGVDTSLEFHYDLSYDQNFIQINYVGFAYNNAELLHYRYMLEGIDKQWVFSNKTTAQYTTLPPGEYKFYVSAMNKKGFWSEQHATFTVKINPPIWKTWWFIATNSGLLIVIVLSLFVNKIKNIRIEAERKTALEKKFAAIELQALRAQMNPHFMFNTLSSIQHYITKNDSESALRYLSKFAKLMRQIMDNSRTPVIALQNEIDALELYLELEAQRFKGKFSYEIKVSIDLDLQYDQIPGMLIQPYVENAILHGITPKEGHGYLFISLEKDDTHIKCIIDDDGIGRKQSQRVNAKNKDRHVSQGMSITKERLEILNTAYSQQLSVNIVDKIDASGADIGTRIELFIPNEID